MSTLVQAFNVRKGHRRAVRVRRVRPHRKRDGGSKLPLDSPDDTLELAHPRELPERFLTPKAHRAAITTRRMPSWASNPTQHWRRNGASCLPSWSSLWRRICTLETLFDCDASVVDGAQRSGRNV